MSKLEKAIVSIVEVFEEYAGKDEQKSQLSTAELRDLIKAELKSPEFKVRVWKMHWKNKKLWESMPLVEGRQHLQWDVATNVFSLIKGCAVEAYYGNLAWKEFTPMSHNCMHETRKYACLHFIQLEISNTLFKPKSHWIDRKWPVQTVIRFISLQSLFKHSAIQQTRSTFRQQI